MAQNKKPLALHIAGGNKSRLTKEEIAERRRTEVQAPVGTSEPPSWLTAVQKRAYTQYAEQLIALNIFSDLDRETLAIYVVAISEYQRYTKIIRKQKPESLDPEVMAIIRSYAIERERSYKQAKSCAGELGLTISSRCRLVIPQVEKEKPNKFEQMRQQQTG